MAVLASVIAGVILAVVASFGMVTKFPDTPDKSNVSVLHYGHR